MSPHFWYYFMTTATPIFFIHVEKSKFKYPNLLLFLPKVGRVGNVSTKFGGDLVV